MKIAHLEWIYILWMYWMTFEFWNKRPTIVIHFPGKPSLYRHAHSPLWSRYQSHPGTNLPVSFARKIPHRKNVLIKHQQFSDLHKVCTIMSLCVHYSVSACSQPPLKFLAQLSLSAIFFYIVSTSYGNGGHFYKTFMWQEFWWISRYNQERGVGLAYNCVCDNTTFHIESYWIFKSRFK